MGLINMIENPDLKAALEEAIEAQDPEKFLDAIGQTVDAKADAILQRELTHYDDEILKARGARLLTSEEKKYYNALIDAMKSGDFKAAVRSIETVFPETVIDEIFDELEQEHHLLSHVDLKHVNIKTKILYAVSDDVKAAWSSLTGKITQEVSGEFKEMEVYQLKLSAFIPVPESMLDLGPVYLDRFVRTLLYEAIANGLEDAILNNLKSDGGPIGMVADMENGTTASGVTTYTKKTAIKVTDWTPKGLAAVLKKMAKTRAGRPRKVGNLFMVVNPLDYYGTIRPAICVQNISGDWVEKSPIPVTIVESVYMEQGKAIIGINNKYMLGIGTAEAGKIEQSDEFDFLNDNRTYKIKLYGGGEPKDNNAFQILDISGLKESYINVLTATSTVAD